MPAFPPVTSTTVIARPYGISECAGVDWRPMQHARLGRTGLQVSRLCLGTMTFGLQCDEDTSRAILDASADAGITFLDTADVYPLGGGARHRRPHRGDPRPVAAGQARPVRRRHEVPRAALGPTRGTRATRASTSSTRSTRRCAGSAPTTSTCTSCTSPTRTRRSTRRSRRSTTVVRSGKARYVGCSNFLAYRLARAIGRSEARDLVRFESVQPRYNLLFREIERELLPLCEEEGDRRDPVQPARGRAAHRQARPRVVAARRDAVHARRGRPDVPGALLARPRVRHHRRAAADSPPTPACR